MKLQYRLVVAANQIGASSTAAREASGVLPSHMGSHSFAWRRYYPWFAQATVSEDSEFLASIRSRCSTIRSAAFPSHFGGIAPVFHPPTLKLRRVSLKIRVGPWLPGLRSRLYFGGVG